MHFQTADVLDRFGRQIGAVLAAGDVITLSGPLGTGKTTLARGILRGAGHAGEVPSPTFTLVQAYDGEGMNVPIWHADLYRLENPYEVEALSLEDGLREGALLIEWPERADRLLPGPALEIALSGTGDTLRTLTAAVPASWESRWQNL